MTGETDENEQADEGSAPIEDGTDTAAATSPTGDAGATEPAAHGTADEPVELAEPESAEPELELAEPELELAEPESVEPSELEAVEVDPHRAPRRSAEGAALDSVDLDPYYFDVDCSVALLHQVVTAQLAARRAGTQSTRTRAEVSGGGAKPFRQKGTGRARQGSTRAPHWSGGGVALGPKPRSYVQRTPKKMVALALRGALSDRARLGRVCVVDAFDWESPSTRRAVQLLGAFGASRRVLVVTEREDEVAQRSFRNLPYVQVSTRGELAAYDVLRADWLLFSDATLPRRAGADEGAEPDRSRRGGARRRAAAARDLAADQSPSASPEEVSA